LAGGIRRLEHQLHAARDISHVRATREPRARSEWDAVATGAHASQDELFPQLVVVLAVDHGQANRSRTACEIHVLDVQLVVVVHARHQAAIRIAGGADRRVLVERNGVGFAFVVQRSKGPVHVDARDDDHAHA
jgi:hypothetical protein